MALFCLLALGAIGYKLGVLNAPPPMENYFMQSYNRFLPGLMQEEPRYHSFATQEHQNVRLPFGNPNVQQTSIDTMDMLSSPKYQEDYQRHYRVVHPVKGGTVSGSNFLLDPAYNSPLNNYSNPHMSEPLPKPNSSGFQMRGSKNFGLRTSLPRLRFGE
jgi:hypothetical protein